MSVKPEAQKRHLKRIAEDIDEAWPNPWYGAVPYLDALRELNLITDNFYDNNAEDIVRRFLINASTWRGDAARRIKAELRLMISKPN